MKNLLKEKCFSPEWIKTKSKELSGDPVLVEKTISEHIGNIFKEGEVIKNSVVRNFWTATQHGAIA